MKPIKRGLLPDTATICNAYKDPDTGKVVHFRTRLSHTRFMKETRALDASKGPGATRSVAADWWVDPISSTGRDPAGGAAKQYAEPRVWETLADREAYWTIQEGDLVFRGEAPGPGAESPVPFHYIVASVTPVFDKPGNVHHWEVELV